jgi:hypothetical protein
LSAESQRVGSPGAQKESMFEVESATQSLFCQTASWSPAGIAPELAETSVKVIPSVEEKRPSLEWIR